MAAPGKAPPPSERGETRRSPAAGAHVSPSHPQPPLGTAASLYLAVGLGSAIGGSIRWLLSDPMLVPFGAGFPWGSLFVNVTGSFLIGLYAALVGPGGRLMAGPIQRHFFMTGLFGGYTTFSIFSLETIRLLETGRPGTASLVVALSLAGWMAAVWVGYTIGRGARVIRPRTK
jgi:fluoride exporter